jgi:hypothetical protein
MQVPSEFEDQSVDSLDFSNLGDDELEDIAENDSRSTAQNKAQAELDRRESAEDAEDGSDEADSEPQESGVTGDVGLDDPMARAEALGLNAEGINVDPDAGQAQVQAYYDKLEESGTQPPSGPPSDALTLEKAVEREQQEKEARAEAQKEAWS